MKKILVTGGTVFVSKYVAKYYVDKGYEVYVLNRNTRCQVEGVKLIEADRHAIGEKLRAHYFDVIMDITAYTAEDVNGLLDAVGGYGQYIMVSSSAVYPEYAPQPFKEETEIGENKHWGMYGINKIKAEETLLKRVPEAYIVRPPYLYGPMNNVYRESFVFECARNDRKFYQPKDGQMKLQFFYIDDLCRFFDVIMEEKPEQRVFNVGNRECVSINEWVKLCYKAAGKQAEFVNVAEDVERSGYFCFRDYEYCLDLTEQEKIMPHTKSMEAGLKEAYEWYVKNSDEVNRKGYFEFIDESVAYSQG